MCMVSMIGDDWREGLPKRYPDFKPWVNPHPLHPLPPLQDTVSREEFERLKAEMCELRKLLEAAKKYDEATGQPDCEMDEKVALLKRLAELVGVEMPELTGKATGK